MVTERFLQGLANPAAKNLFRFFLLFQHCVCFSAVLVAGAVVVDRASVLFVFSLLGFVGRA
jgi:hypothetical protein